MDGAGGDGADLPARASASDGAGSDDGSEAQASAVASGAEEAGRGEGSASGSGGLFGSTGRLRSVDREDAGRRAGATLEVVETICEETVRKVLKKRTETVAAGNMMHSAGAKLPFRGRHGAGAQGIPTAVRPGGI